MNKKANIKNINVKLAAFWSIIGIATLAFIVIAIIMFTTLRPVDSYSDIKRDNLNLIGNEMFNREEKEYYVFVYDSNSKNTKVDITKAEEVNTGVFNYFNFVRHNSKSDNLKKIYGLDVDFSVNKEIISNNRNYVGVTSFANLELRESEVPVLLRIVDGGIDLALFGTNEILKELQTAINDTVIN